MMIRRHSSRNKPMDDNDVSGSGKAKPKEKPSGTRNTKPKRSTGVEKAKTKDGKNLILSSPQSQRISKRKSLVNKPQEKVKNTKGKDKMASPAVAKGNDKMATPAVAKGKGKTATPAVVKVKAKTVSPAVAKGKGKTVSPAVAKGKRKTVSPAVSRGKNKSPALLKSKGKTASPAVAKTPPTNVDTTKSPKTKKKSVGKGAADSVNVDSPASDLYDFGSYEENLAPTPSLTSPTSSSLKLKRKSQNKSSSERPKKMSKVLSNDDLTNKLQNSKSKPKAKEGKKTGLNVSKNTLRMTAMKKCVRNASLTDSGVFMTPSPMLDPAAAFDKSLKSKPTSTPTGIAGQKNEKDCKLGAPIIPPPDLSPVKHVVSPSYNGVHGNLLTSPEGVDTLSSLDDTSPPQQAVAIYVEVENNISQIQAQEEDDVSPPTAGSLDISKTYHNRSFKTLEEKIVAKKSKGKSQKRYSSTKVDAWADEKATEFEEIENFELSIEAE